jgi:hypothetical protein
VPNELSRDQLNQLARLGAKARLAELRQELAALNALINGGVTEPAATEAAASETPSVELVRPRRRRRVTWTAAQRRAVSERMKKYWAAKRAGRKK